MPITAQQLLQIFPNAGKQAGVFAPVLNTAMGRFRIIGAKRIAAFIAQIGHESGQLVYVREIWGPTAAQSRYEGRADLGNTMKAGAVLISIACGGIHVLGTAKINPSFFDSCIVRYRTDMDR